MRPQLLLSFVAHAYAGYSDAAAAAKIPSAARYDRRTQLLPMTTCAMCTKPLANNDDNDSGIHLIPSRATIWWKFGRCWPIHWIHMFNWIEFCVRKVLFWFRHSMCFAVLAARSAHARLEWGKMDFVFHVPIRLGWWSQESVSSGSKYTLRVWAKYKKGCPAIGERALGWELTIFSELYWNVTDSKVILWRGKLTLCNQPKSA